MSGLFAICESIPMPNETLDQLLDMTRLLGQPHLNYVIIGEGNTSYRVDNDTFWIKASGQGMNGISAEGFVQVKFAPILTLLEQRMTDAALQAAMQSAKVDTSSPTRPSVEVTFHAILLHGCDVRCIAHTHPLAVNAILCSSRAEQFASNRMFPDEVVLCGPRSVFVPYVDPGLPLALAIRDRVRGYMQEFGEAPKVILMQNHGLIALGQTPTEAINITAMCVKAAGIFGGACALGEPVFMSRADIMHIYRRPDEIYRRKLFVG
jgi:rhamnose utilization protein RhaD (predicted bifunctional aldolase and dehydrogenase)